MPFDLGRVHLAVVVDEASLERACEKIRARLEDVVGDPVLARDLMHDIVQSAPIVRWVMT